MVYTRQTIEYIHKVYDVELWSRLWNDSTVNVELFCRRALQTQDVKGSTNSPDGSFLRFNHAQGTNIGYGYSRSSRGVKRVPGYTMVSST